MMQVFKCLDGVWLYRLSDVPVLLRRFFLNHDVFTYPQGVSRQPTNPAGQFKDT